MFTPPIDAMPPTFPASLDAYAGLLLDAICIVDSEGRFLHVSAAGERIFGYTAAEMAGRPMIELVYAEDRERTLRTVDDIMQHKPQPHFENRYVRKDGQLVHIMWSARWSPEEQVRIAVARDVTARKQAEARQAALYAISEVAHAACDLPTLNRKIKDTLATLLPIDVFAIALCDGPGGDVRLDCLLGDAGEQGAGVQARCRALVQQERACPSPEGMSLADGSENWLGVTLNSQQGISGALLVQRYGTQRIYNGDDLQLLQYVSTQVAAAIERQRMLERLQRSAFYDPLSGLPNRALFHDRMQSALLRARREQGLLALLFIDLDRFKEVNDEFGHATGDLLLEKVARRLERGIRACDTLARIGGDEFAILLEGMDLPQQAEVVIAKIRHAFLLPFELAGRSFIITPSIGMAQYPMHGSDEKQLLVHADRAMYRNKRQGSGMEA